MKALVLVSLLFAASVSHAGFEVDSAANKVLGFAAKVGCGAGLTCVMSGAKVTITAPGTNGMPVIAGSQTTFIPYPVTATTGIGTSTAGVSGTMFVTQLYVDNNATLTGIAVNNAATVGTNKYFIVLYSATGQVLATTATAGVTTAGASAWQKIPFTATVNVTGPSVYYVGVILNGTTDTVYTIPAAGEYVGTAGTVTGQTFGTAAAITPPTTFTAGQGPIVHTY